MSELLRVLVFDRVSYRHSFFTYRNPVSARVGDLVRVPFGHKSLIGLVVGTESESEHQLRDIIERLSATPIFCPQQIRVWLWMSDYYLAPLIRILENALPKKIRQGDLRVPMSRIVRLLSVSAEKKLGSRQTQLLEILSEQGELDISLLREQGISTATVGSLVKLSCVEVIERELFPEVFPASEIGEFPELTSEQEAVIEQIKKSKNHKFLLHGITGSGKTEVYLHLVREELARNKSVMIIVPEIALTPQLLERFSARFPGQVALLHSELGDTERKNEWLKIHTGRARIVIGSRLAVFAPVRDLGLIVIDESHEWTLKQTETAPRYDARTVAERLAIGIGARLVLGSATPRVEDYYRAQSGELELLELSERAIARATLPEVTIIDMRTAGKGKHYSVLSPTLIEKLEAVIAAGEQAIIFLNRRGLASSVHCSDCGQVEQCPHCDLALTLHQSQSRSKLICHTCGYLRDMRGQCDKCGSSSVRMLGVGTAALEQEISQLFPQARIQRMDRDTTTKKNSSSDIYHQLKNREVDILIGTQMIAKGLDLPGVSLVGIINADIGLHFPHFRASEKTFQLLVQVAGRSGRTEIRGEVVLQTYSPENIAIRHGAVHDYRSFYAEEIEIRRELELAPFVEELKLIYTHESKSLAYEQLHRLKSSFQKLIPTFEFSLLGPTPALIPRQAGRYHFWLILRGQGVRAVLDQITLPEGVRVDVDPVG